MRAALLTGYGRELVLDEVARPSIQGPDEVIVRVSGAGVCGSDVHLRDGMFADTLGIDAFPYVMGHENVGIVDEVGPAVRHLHPGDAVALHPLVGCGSCAGCRSGRDMYCIASRFPGVDGVAHGGFAEYLRTSARSCVPLDPGVDPVSVAALTDAGLTGHHAVVRAVPHLRPGAVAVVLGAGGVGLVLLQSLRALLPATTVVADVRKARLDDAAALGADATVLVDPDADDAELWAGHLGEVDVVFDCVGSAATSATALLLLRRGGVLSIVGATPEPVALSTADATVRELTVLGNYVGTHQELRELLGLAAAGRVVAAQRTYPLADAERALRDLIDGELGGRAVLVP